MRRLPCPNTLRVSSFVPYLTIPEAAKLFQFSPQRIRRLIFNQKLAWRWGEKGRILVAKPQLQAYKARLARRRATRPPEDRERFATSLATRRAA